MELFSERYGYAKPSDVIIREQITPEIESAICNSFEFLRNGSYFMYCEINKYIWTHFLNKKIKDYTRKDVAIDYIENCEEWFLILDLIDFTINHSKFLIKEHGFNDSVMFKFIDNLNFEFNRLNFAYRIVDGKVVEITSKDEINTIEDALLSNEENIKSHLSKALELYALKPEGDYCNSIKESISAVEAYCREKTGENTLGDALKKLEKVGIIIPNILKVAFDKLYAYTNQPTTGIRHALMDIEGTYVPKAEEALFMLVSCSAFINYLSKKSNL